MKSILVKVQVESTEKRRVRREEWRHQGQIRWTWAIAGGSISVTVAPMVIAICSERF
jgi:uncharacterized membrane protein YsdA (DUF1294 family)